MYDIRLSRRVLRFFEKGLKLTVGRFRGKPFELLPWQAYTLCQIFGHVDSEGLRLCREAYVQVAKKNGKSEFAAGVALYMLVADNEPASHVYGAAASREQAGLVFNVASAMVHQSRILSERLQVYPSRKRIVLRRDPSSFYQVISADENTGDGVNPHAVIFDEVHRQKSSGLYSALRYGTAARSQPLFLGLTTAGAEGASPVAQDLYDRTKAGIDDRAFFGLVFEGDPKNYRRKGSPGIACKRSTIERGGKLWRRKPRGWYAGNPSLEGNPGGFLKLAALEKDFQDAQTSPRLLQDFIRLRLDTWTESTVRWIEKDAWGSVSGRVDRKKLHGRRCWVGMDLSSTRDVTAVAWLFEGERSESWEAFVRLYLPEDGIKSKARRDNVPYEKWAAEQQITLTPGPSVDYDFIYRDIVELSKLYRLVDVTSDRWNAQGLASDLDKAGFTVRLVSQGFGDVSPAAKELERSIDRRAIRIEQNDCLDWMAACTEVIEDANKNIRLRKPDRNASKKRIDGIQALVNAFIGQANRQPEQSAELIVLGA